MVWKKPWVVFFDQTSNCNGRSVRGGHRGRGGGEIIGVEQKQVGCVDKKASGYLTHGVTF